MLMKCRHQPRVSKFQILYDEWVRKCMRILDLDEL